MDPKEQKKKRIAMINSIMSNPNLSRTIHEGASSPLGSTKRDKAKAIISILNKTNPQKNDGQGGLGDMSSSSLFGGSSQNFGLSNTPTSPILPLNSGGSNSVTIFPNAPSLKKSGLTGAGSSNTLSNSLSKFSLLNNTKNNSMFSDMKTPSNSYEVKAGDRHLVARGSERKDRNGPKGSDGNSPSVCYHK